MSPQKDLGKRAYFWRGWQRDSVRPITGKLWPPLLSVCPGRSYPWVTLALGQWILRKESSPTISIASSLRSKYLIYLDGWRVKYVITFNGMDVIELFQVVYLYSSRFLGSLKLNGFGNLSFLRSRVKIILSWVPLDACDGSWAKAQNPDVWENVKQVFSQLWDGTLSIKSSPNWTTKINSTKFCSLHKNTLTFFNTR